MVGNHVVIQHLCNHSICYTLFRHNNKSSHTDKWEEQEMKQPRKALEKLEDSLAANACNPREDTPSSAKEGDVSLRGVSATITLALLDATLGTLSS